MDKKQHLENKKDTEISSFKVQAVHGVKDAFFQGLEVNDLIGHLFYFGRGTSTRHVKNKKIALDEIEKYRLAHPETIETNPYDIVADPDFGFPGAVAYKTFTGCEKYISDLYDLFDGVVEISHSNAVRMSDRRTNDGRAFEQVKNGIRQLETVIIIKWEFDEQNRPVFTEIIPITGHRRTYSNDHKQIINFYLQINPAFSNYIKTGKKFSCMSWSRLRGLSPQAHRLSRILYVKFSKLYSKERNIALPYIRDYHFICKNWMGGAKPLAYPTRVKRDQLNSPYGELIERGVLKAFDVKKNTGGNGMNVLHYMGQGFIEDYNFFYNGKKSQLQKLNSSSHKTTPLVSKSDILDLLDFFSEKYRGTKPGTKLEYLQKEFDYARSLLSGYDLIAAKEFIVFSIKAANRGGFEMRSLNAIKVYENDFKVECQKLQTRKQKLVEEDAHTKTFAETFGTTERIQIVPELMWLPTTAYTIEEQYHEFTKKLTHLPKRYGIVVMPELANFEIYTLDMEQAPCNDDRLARTKMNYLTADNSPYISRVQLQEDIQKRQIELKRKATNPITLPDVDVTEVEPAKPNAWAEKFIEDQTKDS